ncbi:MAG: hypothetical protein RL662_2015 [Bacteroidota bacterium]|jgi:PBP1b-binding outer membrane lipoprotein LpoB
MKKSILIALFAVFLVSCTSKNADNKQAAEADTKEQSLSMADASIINVYYFHGKQRCKTCIAIENVTKNAIADSYKDNPNVRYVEVNIDEAQNKDLVEKYEIAFSSLLIAKADNATDLTELAFANAVNSPDVLTSLIKDEVNKRID